MKIFRIGFHLALLLATTNLFAQSTNGFSRLDARPAPQWLRDGVVYEIFPRNFSLNGNLTGITARLDELKDLGVTILWLMPIHPIGKVKSKGTYGSCYAITDYYAIHPDLGTTNDFKKLVSEAHVRGLKIIMDIVANHTAWDSVMMEHPGYYKRDPSGKVLPPVPEWTDVAGLNYENPQTRRYMIDMMKFWLREFDVDGFRCDVAYMVPTSFWEQVRLELEKIKPDLMMLAEATHPELLVKAFDIDYSWPLLGTLNKVLQEGAPASDLQKNWEEGLQKFPRGSLHLRISDNHDESRAIARFGKNAALTSSALMFSLDGVPLIYNGMEVGDATESGDPALFEKLPIFWHPKEREHFRRVYRELIKLRRNYAPFRNERVIWLKNSDPQNLVTLMRLDEKDEFVTVINFANRPLLGKVEVMNAKEFQSVDLAIYRDESKLFPVLDLKPFEFRIYHRAVRR
jgi:cyclomaltodextrinase / maltogenic alpha-amylase / neopullulanase